MPKTYNLCSFFRQGKFIIWVTQVFFCPYTQIQVLPEGGEMPIFKQFFKAWKEKDQAEGLGRVYVTERIAKIKQVFDASKLHTSNQMAAQYNMVDNGTGETQVQICIQEIRDCISSIVLAFGIAEDEHLIIKIILKMNDFCIKKLCSHLPLFSEMQ